MRVTLRAGSRQADFDKARKGDALREPGIRIIISSLDGNPTKLRGPLAPPRLQKVFGQKFARYLKDGALEIVIYRKGKAYQVEPPLIDLPRLGETYRQLSLMGRREKMFSHELYFDPSGKGKVGIRHIGVEIVEDVSRIDAYGLEQSVFGSGYVMGYIDADFLDPLPARTGFEDNEDWIGLLHELDNIRPMIEDEVEQFRERIAEEKLNETQRKAIQFATDILNMEQFADLELLGVGGSPPAEPRFPPNGFDFVPASLRVSTGSRSCLTLKALPQKLREEDTAVSLKISSSSVRLLTEAVFLRKSEQDTHGVVSTRVSVTGVRETGTPATLTATAGRLSAEARIRVAEQKQKRGPWEPRGPKISYVELPFVEGAEKHSRYVTGTVQVNTLNPDHRREKQRKEEAQLAYGALMIGKETIAYSDESGSGDDLLEKMLSFHFLLRHKIAGDTSRGAAPRKRSTQEL